MNKFIKRTFVCNVLGALLILLVLVYHFPFFAVNFFAWNKPFSTKVKIPSYVYQMSDYVNKKTIPESRILLLPPLDSSYGTDGYLWGYWGLDPLPELTINARSIIGRAEDSFDLPWFVYAAISQENELSFLYFVNTYGINKILWRNDILYTNKATSGRDFLELKKNLESFKSISLEKKIDKWSLYNIVSNAIHPLVYLEKPSSQSAVSPVSFKKLNPTKYSVRITNAKENYVLVLSQAFSKGWQVRIENYLPEKNHLPINGFLNGWLIDKKGNYDLFIEYEPQKFTYLGVFISLATIFSLTYCVYKTRKKHRKIL